MSAFVARTTFFRVHTFLRFSSLDSFPCLVNLSLDFQQLGLLLQLQILFLLLSLQPQLLSVIHLGLRVLILPAFSQVGLRVLSFNSLRFLAGPLTHTFQRFLGRRPVLEGLEFVRLFLQL